MPNAVLAVGRLPEEMEVPAGRCHGPTADHHPRPRNDSAPDPLADREPDLVLRPVLAGGRDAEVQHPAHVRGRLQQQDVVVGRGHALAGSAIARGDDVGVGVDESGHDRGAGAMVTLDGGALGCLQVIPGADAHDPAFVDQDSAIHDRRATKPIDQAIGGDDGELGRWLCHGTPQRF
jgi:hypothetical protein